MRDPTIVGCSGNPDAHALRGMHDRRPLTSSPRRSRRARRALPRQVSLPAPPYGSASAMISAGISVEPTATAMYCLPPAIYVMGAPVVPAGRSVSQTTFPVFLS